MTSETFLGQKCGRNWAQNEEYDDFALGFWPQSWLPRPSVDRVETNGGFWVDELPESGRNKMSLLCIGEGRGPLAAFQAPRPSLRPYKTPALRRHQASTFRAAPQAGSTR